MLRKLTRIDVPIEGSESSLQHSDLTNGNDIVTNIPRARLLKFHKNITSPCNFLRCFGGIEIEQSLCWKFIVYFHTYSILVYIIFWFCTNQMQNDESLIFIHLILMRKQITI